MQCNALCERDNYHIKHLDKENLNYFGLAANCLGVRQLDQFLSEHGSQAIVLLYKYGHHFG